MAWINESTIIGMMLVNATQYVTGDLTITYFLITAVLVMLCLIFALPFEFGLLLTMPINIYLIAVDSGYLPIGGTLILFLAVSLALRFRS